MDLEAYLNIDDLSIILEDNKIDVPRLRGLSLMKDEEPSTKEYVDSAILFDFLWTAEYRYGLCEKNLRYSRDKNGHWVKSGINWRTVHGKKRKKIRFLLKKTKQKVVHFFEVRKKYCGRKDVIRIHARIGGNNWLWYDGPELEKQPWFLEKVDDFFDNTYCDIYAKIGANDD